MVGFGLPNGNFSENSSILVVRHSFGSRVWPNGNLRTMGFMGVLDRTKGTYGWFRVWVSFWDLIEAQRSLEVFRGSQTTSVTTC
jgi:hypothetical protein